MKVYLVSKRYYTLSDSEALGVDSTHFTKFELALALIVLVFNED